MREPAVLVAVVALVGCTSRPHDLDIALQFLPAEVQARTVRIEIEIHEGPYCASRDPIVMRRWADGSADAPPQLRAGAHSVLARAIDAACRVIATQPCIDEVVLPLADGAVLPLVLQEGAGGPACAPGEECSAGECVHVLDGAARDGGRLDGTPGDGGGCGDVRTDIFNCGGCGVVCPVYPNTSPTCTGGDCGSVCVSRDFLPCTADVTAGCRDITTPTDCGACNVPCSPATPFCARLADGGLGCIATCAGSDCGGTCVDTRTDARHCGACGTNCGAGACEDGACVCGDSWARCDVTGGYTCVDSQRDPMNCGGCGNVCEWLELCIGGDCECQPGTCRRADGHGCTTVTLQDGGCGGGAL